MLKDVSVIGAAGKMGRGISLIVLQVMAQSKLIMPEERFTLNLVDSDRKALDALRLFLRDHLRKFAEKKINLLRKLVASNPELVSNEKIIASFVEQGMDCAWFSTEPKGAEIVFEAIVEDVEAKAMLYQQLQAELLLTNTSSIPIHVLQSEGRVKGPMAGFHFYNPPHIQSLIELAFPDKVQPGVRERVMELVKTFEKTAVESKDVAGFIGNGHFIREVNEACRLVEELGGPLPQAVYMVNKITGDFLLRPMGIFELIDYIGFDVCQRIAEIMSHYLKPLVPPLFKEVQGGFFQYEQTVPVAVMGVPLPQVAKECDEKLGAYPRGYAPWKKLLKDPQKREKVLVYLQALSQETGLGARLAGRFLEESQKIARGLVKEGVAHSLDDVSTVLMQGFHHLYGVLETS